MDVAARFSRFLSNISLTDDQKADGERKHFGVRNCLNQVYYGWNSDTANSRLIGSWGKRTRIRPPRDIDVLFVLPDDVYQRFQQRTGNKQSQLLQEVRYYLGQKYKNTDIKGDGPVVLVPFVSYQVELVPAFKLNNNQYYIPRTERGGFYKTADPDAEIKLISDSHKANGNTRHLIRMLKCWQANCNVSIRSFWLELFAANFLATYTYSSASKWLYDWMVRDFFESLKRKGNTYLTVPGTYESMFVGDDWVSRAESAHSRAVKACQFELDGKPYSAGGEWQKIFGDDIPTG
jgi:hypothetical protein